MWPRYRRDTSLASPEHHVTAQRYELGADGDQLAALWGSRLLSAILYFRGSATNLADSYRKPQGHSDRHCGSSGYKLEIRKREPYGY